MATVMVADEHDEVQRLLSHMVARVGHTPVLWTAAQGDALHGFEALLVEPAFPGCFRFAKAVRSARPELPIVCVSIYPPTPDVRALGCVVHLLKPFSLHELESALEQAVLASPARNTQPAR
ncbi:MAG TPA: response regulator [Gaiellaceae bacterium]|nr:response regulator [Gaiellaceae bacterium]